MPVFQFTYDDDLAAWLTEYAASQDMTPSDVLRRELLWLRRWDRLMQWTDGERRKADFEMQLALTRKGLLDDERE